MSLQNVRFPWWVQIAFSILITVIIISLSQIINVIQINLNLVTIGWVFILIISISLLSTLIGSFVTHFTGTQQIQNAEERLINKFEIFGKELDRLQEDTRKISHLPKKCGKCIRSLNDVIIYAKEITRISLSKFGKSVVTYHDLKEIENSVKENGEIWVLTSALILEEDELKEIILNNFKKKIRYVYLIPKEDKILQNRMIRLARQWKRESNMSIEEAQNQIKCFLVPKHFAYMTVIIYDPYDVPPIVLVKFPTSHIYEKEKYPLIHRVDSRPKEAWKIFLDSIQELIDDKSFCPAVEQLKINFSGISGEPKNPIREI